MSWKRCWLLFCTKNPARNLLLKSRDIPEGGGLIISQPKLTAGELAQANRKIQGTLNISSIPVCRRNNVVGNTNRIP